MIVTKVVIKFTSHTAHICVDNHGHVKVFKYSKRSCDFDFFTDQNEAADYIVIPPEDCYFRVVFSGDE